MRTVTVSWDKTAERFVASGTHRGREIVINAPGRTGSLAGTHGLLRH